MDCIGPIAPDESDFLAYADNAAGAAVHQHISACPACRERALQLVREQGRLEGLLHRAGCPSPLELGEYHLGLASEGQTTELAEHLKHCVGCRSELADLTTFLRRLERPVLDGAEDAARSLRRVVARLSFGPLTGPSGELVPALRGAADAEENVPVVYEAEDVLVTVDSWAERVGQPGRTVAGLVVGLDDFTQAEASIDTPEGFSSSAISDLGNFLFSDVPPGLHHLMIRLPASGIQIEIEELAVK